MRGVMCLAIQARPSAGLVAFNGQSPVTGHVHPRRRIESIHYLSRKDEVIRDIIL